LWVGGIYSLPSYISEGVRDLIPRMLVVDPMKRITVAEIQRHAWFRHNLPKYLAVTADDRLVESRKADAEALGKVITIFQTDAAQARRDIETPGVRNEVTVAYSLILDTLERQRRNQSQGGLLVWHALFSFVSVPARGASFADCVLVHPVCRMT
jgi:5'-AMP-activated protein kinase, catalytic alpha subunit